MIKKNHVFCVILCACGLLFVSCGGGASPKDIPQKLYKAMLEGDVEALQELTTGDTTEEAIKGIDEVKKLNITISEFKVLEVKDVDKEKKDVRIEFVHDESPEEGKYKKKKHEQIFHLVKVEGRWVVDKVEDVKTEDIS